MIETGWAVLFIVHPSLARDTDLNLAQHAAETTWEQKLGAWQEFGTDLLLGYEYRVCIKLGARDSAPLKARAIEAAAGNPRLLDWLDRIISASGVDVEELLTAIESEAVRFRETIFAEKLLNAQPVEVPTMLARINVVDLPVPAATVHALHEHPQVDIHMRRAADLGLLEEGIDTEAGERRYFVSNVLRPLLTDEQYRDACATAARSLYDHWIQQPSPDPGHQP